MARITVEAQDRAKTGDRTVPPDAVLIAGPTASGKSALAIHLAKALNGVVINADSMQVYRDLRVLSARPTPEEEAQAPHRLFGFVPAGVDYSTGAYLTDVARAMDDVRAGGQRPIIVGGTGLYFRALTEGLVETPAISEAVRQQVADAARTGSLDALLLRHDPEAARRLAPADQVRRMRALEVVLQTGRSLTDWQAGAQGAPLLRPGEWRGIVLAPERASLINRIEARFEAMMDQGALDEAARLARLGLPANRGVMKAHGVPHLIAHLNGVISRQEAIALGQRDTRRYAKRQMTWARGFMRDWAWVETAQAGAAVFGV